MSYHPQHTPELVSLLGAMRAKEAALQTVAREMGLSACRQPEYESYMQASRAYWAAVEGCRPAPVKPTRADWIDARAAEIERENGLYYIPSRALGFAMIEAGQLGMA